MVKTYVAGQSTWRLPAEEPPPLGVKMLLLNRGGVCVIGTWGAWALAWAPLPLIPEHIKAEMLPAGYASQPELVEQWKLHAGDAA